MLYSVSNIPLLENADKKDWDWRGSGQKKIKV
jgi:hypothetical protein